LAGIPEIVEEESHEKSNHFIPRLKAKRGKDPSNFCRNNQLTEIHTQILNCSSQSRKNQVAIVSEIPLKSFRIYKSYFTNIYFKKIQNKILLGSMEMEDLPASARAAATSFYSVKRNRETIINHNPIE